MYTEDKVEGVSDTRLLTQRNVATNALRALPHPNFLVLHIYPGLSRPASRKR